MRTLFITDYKTEHLTMLNDTIKEGMKHAAAEVYVYIAENNTEEYNRSRILADS